MAKNSTRRGSEQAQNRRGRCGICIACLFVLAVGVGIYFAITELNGVSEGDTGNTGSTSGGSVRVTSAPAIAATPAPTGSPTVTGFQACNGFENLCDVRVNEVAFATLHNAVSTEEDGVSFFFNHELSLERALAAGWRGLNFDIGRCSSFAENNGVRLIHSTCLLGTRDPIVVFTNILSFLQENPNDVVLMPVQVDGVSLQEILGVMEQVPGFTEQLYQYDNSGVWPTLRQLIAAETRILFFHYNGENCSEVDCPNGFHDWFAYAAETQFEFDSPGQLLTDLDYSCEITRGGGGTRDFFGVNMFTRAPSEESCQALNGAVDVFNHVQNCAGLNDGLIPLVVIVDCWNVGGVLDVANEYNSRLS